MLLTFTLKLLLFKLIVILSFTLRFNLLAKEEDIITPSFDNFMFLY